MICGARAQQQDSDVEEPAPNASEQKQEEAAKAPKKEGKVVVSIKWGKTVM